MVNLEWYRTFKAVYRHGNYSKAAEDLFLSQPAVSKQMAMLEAYIGHKLFIRKSKGVEATENAKFLNNLIIESLDTLEGVEAMYSRKLKKEEQLYVIGISSHLYKSFLADKLPHFKHLSIHFEESNDRLFELVNEQEIDAAIIHQSRETFDTLSCRLLSSPLVIAAHPDIDSLEFEQNLQNEDLKAARLWLENQRWFSHMSTNPFIKLFWLHCFDKQRPKVFTNYVIPNEYLMLDELSRTPGLAITLEENLKPFLRDGRLKMLWPDHVYPPRDYYLIAHKQQADFFKNIRQAYI